MKLRAIYSTAERIGPDDYRQIYKTKEVEVPDDFLTPDGQTSWNFVGFALADTRKEEK